MALGSPSVPIQPQQPQIADLERAASVQSAGTPEMEEDLVYVALGRDYRAGKQTLLWALQNTSAEDKIVVVHVHRPASMIPIMGGKFPASQLEDVQVSAFRQVEKEKMNKVLDEYLALCSQAKVRAEKLVIEMDDVGKGLVELIALHGIINLVMGADRFSKKMKVLKSRTAISVQKQADPCCKIWFVCKGNLICTREASINGYEIVQLPAASAGSRSSQSEPSRLRSLSQEQMDLFNWLPVPMQGISRRRSRSVNFDSRGGGIMASLPLEVVPNTSTTWSTSSTDGSVIASVGGISSAQASDDSSSSLIEVLTNVDPPLMLKDDEIVEEPLMLSSVHASDENLQFSSAREELEGVEMEDEVYEKLLHALTEAESLRREAYDESLRRQKAERDAIEATRKANTSMNLYTRELKQRKEIEERLVRETKALERIKTERDEVFEELRRAHEQESVLELRIRDSNCIVKDLEKRLSEAQHHLISLQRDRDDAVREVEEFCRRKEETSTSTDMAMSFSDFSYSELEQATDNFNDSMRIGEGGYGSVYKGFLRHTTVAIKIMNSGSMQGRSEFHREVNVLSRMRHPHLVTLIGACPEAWALVYEYCSNGSLEDRLNCVDNTPPLTWQARIRIATEICSALIFLHSNKPHVVVHGDLKPANILIDASFVSKLGDFGICHILNQSSPTTLYCHTHPKGTFVYMDPEFLSSGDITSSSDIYSFGVVLLRLLSGKPALGIVKEVQEALIEGRLDGVLDPTAGDWPFVQAKQLAHLALRCCEIKRKKRPDLVGEAWKVLEPMTRAASMGSSSLSSRHDPEDNSCIPSYFICPIFQEIMRDPHIAADGFTYEAEAVKGWLDSGHETSPMTNLKLDRRDLIPNHTLRSAIQEWLQQSK